MNLQDKISSANLPDEAQVFFTIRQGADVFHFNESQLETALEDTDVPEILASVVTSGLDVTTEYGNVPIEVLREADLLEDYERGSFDFEEYVTSAIRENFWDHELIEESTEKYDHKRGFTTLSSTLKALVKDINVRPEVYERVFHGWEASMSTGMGKLTFEV